MGCGLGCVHVCECMCACVYACVLGDSVDSFVFEESCNIHSDSSSSFTLSMKLYSPYYEVILCSYFPARNTGHSCHYLCININVFSVFERDLF